MDLLNILFIIFMIYSARFIIGKIRNPDQPNGDFLLKEYTEELINKYKK